MSVEVDSSVLKNLLSANAKWADEVNKADPDFFRRSAEGQSPQVLWLGCSDSRVPESVITAAKPGDIFVHRNIANQFHLDDDSALSVLAYAVDHVGVTHVVVVGHTHCGGAEACLKASSGPPVNPTTPLARWLAPLTELARSLKIAPMSVDGALQQLVEQNVKVQVENLARSKTIVDAWAGKKKVSIHGWIYDLSSGKLRDLGVSKVGPSPISPAVLGPVGV